MTPEDIASHIADLRADFAGLEKQLADPAIYADQAECRRITQEHRKLAALFQSYDAWVKAIADLAATRELLAAAINRYEKESQPEVIRGAEKLFADFTGGRYTRLYKSVATGELLACDKDSGLEKNFDALSRGTREELMLAMRLALIERIERDGETLPVIFDDVGVNFDNDRLAAVEKAVERFAAKRQVIWFSHN